MCTHVSWCLWNWCFILLHVCDVKGAAKIVNTSAESRVFWLSLVVCQVFWAVFVFAAVITFSLKWLVSDSFVYACHESSQQSHEHLRSQLWTVLKRLNLDGWMDILLTTIKNKNCKLKQYSGRLCGCGIAVVTAVLVGLFSRSLAPYGLWGCSVPRLIFFGTI